ncbi:hypothetical protein BDY21DRAFT_366632 [Lineolata rhizophorae]|uniref:Uncharacterized protein n=1 Tax=Lineolata rhizophorae TaxID=578093 RepID=A0A6A6NQ95_9PEZI|nr:hypothetical protein BDY21DRAFT_366632 [Lineolata rhizophorae]
MSAPQAFRRVFRQTASRTALTNSASTCASRLARAYTTRPPVLINACSSVRMLGWQRQPRIHSIQPRRTLAAQSSADEKIDELQELYSTAKDEFEIAAEETEKATVYAADDRAAAREEFDKLNEAYKAVVDGEDRAMGEEVKRRIGQRVRELENAVIAMEEMAQNQD